MRKESQTRSLRNFLRRKPVKVIAVTGGKGGVGKSNVAANLAIGLGAAGQNVCLLDADVSLANIDVLLGLQPRFNLSHLVSGETDLDSLMLDGPNGIKVIPAATGDFSMTDLPSASQAAIIQSFSGLSSQPDVLVVDTAPGITPDVARYVQAAQHPMVVLCDEPASLTDAYALIKVFSRHYGVAKFHVVTNRTRGGGHGRELFAKLSRVSDTYLDVVLRHLGDIPDDRYLQRAVMEQRAVIEAYPRSAVAGSFVELAASVHALPAARDSQGGIEFFFERMLMSEPENARGKVA